MHVQFLSWTMFKLVNKYMYLFNLFLILPFEKKKIANNH